jgi:hypothetical protein
MWFVFFYYNITSTLRAAVLVGFFIAQKKEQKIIKKAKG